MRDLLKEELKRMLYLTSHKRGVVLSEQEEDAGQLVGTRNTDDSPQKSFGSAPSWGGTQSGQIDVSNTTIVGNLIINAKDVMYKDIKNLTLSIASGIGKALPEWMSLTIPDIPPSKTPPRRSVYTFEDTTFPYADNMIKPYFDKFPDANELFKSCVETLKNNIVEYGMDSIKEIVFKGSADSMPPTDSVPSGYDKLDHDLTVFESEFTKPTKCTKNYCGIKRKNYLERNQFLADRRAGRMVIELLTAVANSVYSSDKKNIDIMGVQKILQELYKKVKIEKGDNFYDGQPGRRGVKNVTVDVIPTEGKLKDGTIIPGKEGGTIVIKIAPKTVKGTFELGGKTVKYLGSAEENGYFIMKLDNDDAMKELLGTYIPDMSVDGKLNGKESVPGKINGDKIQIDNLIWGSLEEHPEHKSNYALLYQTSNTTLCAVQVNENIVKVREFRVILGNSEKMGK